MTENQNVYVDYSDLGTSKNLILIVFFIVWPFGALLYSLYYYYRKESKTIFILFTALYGYSMIAEDKGMDLYRVQRSIVNFTEINWKEFLYKTKNFYSDSESESVDIYKSLITFIVSRFTSNWKWLMLIFGLLYGIAYVKAISLFVLDYQTSKIYNFLIILCFSCIIGLDQLAGVRFSLAAYTYFYGAVCALIYKDNKYIAIAALSILIHFSFLPIVLVLIAFTKLKYLPKLIYIILIFSFILPNFAKAYIFQYAHLFGNAIEARTELYYGMISDLNYGSDTVWYVKNRIILGLIFCYIILIITRLRKNYLNYSERTNDLFFFSLIILSFVNFTIDIPHFGYRFQFVFIMFVFYYLYLVYIENQGYNLISHMILALLPFSSLLVAFTIRSILIYTPFSFFYYNLPGIVLDQSNQSFWSEFFH
jgi:hypothetical protein